MKLTGKDIDGLYQCAYKEARNDNPIGSVVALTWEALAQKINASHIAPLQGRIDELEEQERQILAQAKEALADVEMLVEKYKSLAGLVRDYQEFTKYQTPLLKAGRLAWESESNELCKRATELLKKEQ